MKNMIIYASNSKYELISDYLDEYRNHPVKLVFVPSSKEEYVFKERQEAELLEKLNLNTSTVISLSEAYSAKEWQQILKEADVIYLHGGNPLIFYDYLTEKGCLELLREHQGLIIGLSAGAMLLSDNIVLTPSNDEYTEFIFQKALSRSPLNLFVHMNYQDVVTSTIYTMDGEMRLIDLVELSYKGRIDLLADRHFIIKKENQFDYVGHHFYQIENGILYKLIDNEFIRIDITPDTLVERSDTHTFIREYETMESAMKNGRLSSLFKLDLSLKQQPLSLSLMNLEEFGMIYQQADTPTFKSWIIDHPQLKYGSISLTIENGKVIERLRIKTRYMLFIEQLKVWPKII